MRKSLSRPGDAPHPPKVCITHPIPTIGGWIWIGIVNGQIIGPVPGPWWGTFDADVTPNLPNTPPGQMVQLTWHTATPPVITFTPNQQQSHVSIGLDQVEIGHVVRIDLVAALTGESAVWYERIPRQEPN